MLENTEIFLKKKQRTVGEGKRPTGPEVTDISLT